MGLSQGQGGDQSKTGYAVGMSIGKNVANLKGLIDEGSLSKGITDQLAGKPKLDEAKMREALNELTTRQQAAQKEKNAASSAKNKAEGAAYLEKNKAKAGVKVTASGLQYEVIKAGSGPRPKATNTVRVHYTGTLIDGTKFDSSVDRGQPAEFPLNGVIKGWTEGVALMPVGSKYKFTIPSELAYGSNGAGAQIGPDAVLIFEVELLKIVK
jgi:FKBP-type peptidyl-prolyl cis-trans isomerase